MQEQGSGGGGSSMLRTRPNTIIRGEVQGEYVVRGAKIKCSKALKEEAYDVVNLPLCHGVYSGKEPLINIKDMKDGENIVNGFGICSETGTPCVDEMKFHINWINRKKIRLHIEGEEAVTTNSFTMCSAHGGEITFENSGQTAVYHPKNEKNKEDLMGEEARDKTMDSMTSLMACEKGLKDLSHQWFEASGNPKKQKSLHEQADKIREHMVYLAESSPVRPEILLDLKRSIGDGTTEKQHLRPDEVMAINVINEALKKDEAKEEVGFWDSDGVLYINAVSGIIGGWGQVKLGRGMIVAGTLCEVAPGPGTLADGALKVGGAYTSLHGASNMLSGAVDIYEIATDKNKELGDHNIMKMVYVKAGEILGGDEGAITGENMYYAVDTGINVLGISHSLMKIATPTYSTGIKNGGMITNTWTKTLQAVKNVTNEFRPINYNAGTAGYSISEMLSFGLNSVNDIYGIKSNADSIEENDIDDNEKNEELDRGIDSWIKKDY